MKDAEGEDIKSADCFALVEDMPAEGEDLTAEQHAAELIQECEEFLPLKISQPFIVWIMRFGVKMKGGKTVLGEMMKPQFQGGLAPVGAWLLAEKCGGVDPDFLCILDLMWWRTATPHQRRALVHHELKHIRHKVDADGEKKFDDDGNPVWELAAHDLEEFRDTVRRFGDFAGDVAPFLEAASEGGVKA